MPEPQVIDGIYTLDERIGEGGMAEVYRAHVDLDRFDYTMLYAYTQVQGDGHADRCRKAEAFARELSSATLDLETMRTILAAHGIPLPGTPVALKLSRTSMNVERFEAEWKNLVCLHHANVIQVYGGGMLEDRPYYAMEMLPGILPAEEVVRGFSLSRKIEYLKQAAAGLGFLHENGIVHRDVKPDNLIACRGAEGAIQVKVTDLGIAKASSQGMNLTVTQTVMGTPSFMSPEQARSSKHVDARSDVYSLGATLYLLLGQQLPFAERSSMFEVIAAISHGETPVPLVEINPGAPATLCRIVDCAMAPEPDQRYATMVELIRDLEHFLEVHGSMLDSEQSTVQLGGGTAISPLDPATLAEMHKSFLFSEHTRPAAALVEESATVAFAPPSEVGTAPTGPAGAASGRSRYLVAALVFLVVLLGGVLLYQAGRMSDGGGRRAGRGSVSGAEQDPEERFQGLFDRLQKDVDTEDLETLEAALATGNEAMSLARSNAERAAIGEILGRLSTRRAVLRRSLDYKTWMARGEEAFGEGKFEEASAAARKALTAQETAAAKDLQFRADRASARQRDWNVRISQGATHLKARAWGQAEKAFLSAMDVAGYKKDETARAGLADARRGRHKDLVARATTALAARDWEAAGAAAAAARQIPGHEADRHVLSLQRQAREGAEAEQLAGTYGERLKKATALAAAGKLAEAEGAYLAALKVKGRSEDRAALTGLKGVRQRRFARALTGADKALAAEEWSPAVAGYEKALAVSGYGENPKAKAGLTLALAGERQSAWRPEAMPKRVSGGVNGGWPDGTTRLPDVRPVAPDTFGYYRP